MAKIRLGGIVAEASGSLDGVVFSHNRNGRYVRARVKPTNPRSVKQQQVRSQLGTLSQNWRTLTAAQRTAWTNLGSQMTQTNSIGEATTLTGLQAYVSVNQNKLFAGQPITGTAPILDSAPTFTVGAIVSTVASGGAFTVATTTIPSSTQTVRVYATGPISAGRNFIRKSQYRLLQTITAASVSPIDLKAAWTAVYGPIVTVYASSKVSLLFVPVSATGIAGPSVRADTFWS